MGSIPNRPFDVKSVAIIGAGPAGLAAAKYLAAQGVFEITVFEQQSEVGGVWYYSPTPSQTLHVPQVSADCPPDPPVRDEDGGWTFPSPMYGLLHTNIPGSLMQYSDAPFGEDATVFPSRQEVQRYLVRYSQDVRSLIRFQTVVKDARLVHGPSRGREKWEVDVISTATGQHSTQSYDAVVVASGHYSTIYIPDIPNIRTFHATHPDIISHSKLYRHPEAFKDKKVIVVGNAASGIDIATQINRVAGPRVLLSVRTPTAPDMLEHSGCEEVPEIVEFLVQERGVRFKDGRVEGGIDAILFATGYLFTYPFLKSLQPGLVTDGRRVYGLYKDVIHIEHPTLVFPGLPIKVVPFPLCESQAAIYARAWANILSLPSKEAMRQWEDDAAETRGHAFHVYPKGGDTEYINSTYDWVTSVSDSYKGKTPPRWSEELVWQRRIYAEAKLKFEQTGRTAKSLEELGFRYEPEPDAVFAPEIL